LPKRPKLLSPPGRMELPFPQGGMELLGIKLAFPHRRRRLKCTREQFPLKNKFRNQKIQEINFVQIKYLLYHLKDFEV
jgi:hypothetical protein